MTYPTSTFLTPLDPVTRDQDVTRMCQFYTVTKGLDVAAKRADVDKEFSEAYIAYQVKKWYGLVGDRGATTDQVAEVIKRFGICPRSDFNPGHDWSAVPGLAAELHAQLELPIELIYLPYVNDDVVLSLKRQICFGKVPLVTFAFGDGFRTAVNGVPWRDHRLPVATANFYMEHAMPIVGYDDDAQCFVCANSEGPNVGDNGYIGLPYDQVRNGPQNVAKVIWILQTSKYPSKKVDGFMAEIATLNAAEIAEARQALKLKWTQNVAAILPENPTWQQIIDGFVQLGGRDRHVEICFEMRRGDLGPVMQANNLTAPPTFFEPF